MGPETGPGKRNPEGSRKTLRPLGDLTVDR